MLSHQVYLVLYCNLYQTLFHQSDAGLKASEYIERGGLVPDQLMVDLILNELKGLSSVDWLLDGM